METVKIADVLLTPKVEKEIPSTLPLASFRTVGVNEYRVDYDKHGLIRAQFVIDKSVKPWGIIEFLDEKVSAKFEKTQIFSIKCSTYPMEVNKLQWAVRWLFPGARIKRKVEL